MEALAFLFVLVVVALLAAPILAIIALVRSGKVFALERRIAAIEETLGRLERRLRSIGAEPGEAVGTGAGGPASARARSSAAPATFATGAARPETGPLEAGPSTLPGMPIQGPPGLPGGGADAAPPAGFPAQPSGPPSVGGSAPSGPPGTSPRPGLPESPEGTRPPLPEPHQPPTAAPARAGIEQSAGPGAPARSGAEIAATRGTPGPAPRGGPLSPAAQAAMASARTGSTPQGAPPSLRAGRGDAATPQGGVPIRIDWERWIGIRGAALLGGIVFALAGLLLFQYSIQHGWVTPTMRVVTGVIVAIGCLVASEWLHSREYHYTPEAMAGAAIVILYASFWAAHTLYALVPLGVAFGLMVLVTIVCCLLSLRHESQIVAILGLVGGFATPLLLHSDVDRPIGLFGYVLLLDLGLLAIGRNKRWPALGVLSLAGTVLIQGVWIVFRMGPDRLVLGLGILALFAILFALAGQLSGAADRKVWLASQVGAVLLPFAFALYFASRVDLGPHLYPIALLIGLLAVAAGWVGKAQKAPWLGVGAACGAVAVSGIWLTQHELTPALAWEAVGVAAALSAIFHLFVEWEPEPAGFEGPAAAAILSSIGFFVLLILAAALSPAVSLWPSLAGWLFLAAILYRHAAHRDREALQVLGAFGVGIGLAVFHLVRAASAGFPGWPLFLGLTIGLGVLAQFVALARRDETVREHASHAAAALPAVVLLSLSVAPTLASIEPALALGSSLVLGVLIATAATRIGAGAWYAVGGAFTALVHALWTAQRFGLLIGISPWLEETLGIGGPRPGADPGAAVLTTPGYPVGSAAPGALVALGLALLGAVFFTAWPFLARGKLSADRASWYMAALAAPMGFAALRRLFSVEFGNGFIGLLPLLLGALTLGAAFRTRSLWDATNPMRKSFLAWFSAVALSFVSVAIPLQLSKQWITIGWAVEGYAVIALWKRLDHAGLKYYGVALLMGSTARLLVNPALLGYYPRSDLRIINWLAYTYLVPGAALIASAMLLRGVEAARAEPWEADLYRGGHDVGSVVCTLGGIFVVFAWINLAIVDYFATGPRLTLQLAHVPACDLTLSIAWAVYALVLLGFGMAGGSSALRWLSLSFLVLTIGKVFLYDLGELKDLYRVASLVGLAVSLLFVSLLYQRFVFRKTPEETPR